MPKRTSRDTARRALKRPAAKKAAKKAGTARYSRRADLGAPADAYFARIEPAALRAIGKQLREIVRAAAPRASEAIKWGMPVYEQDGMLCYIRARPKYITLGFYHQGVYLPDADGRLEGSGDAMRHVKVADAAAIDKRLFAQWVKRAAAMNAGG
jgi:hypothetical protein